MTELSRRRFAESLAMAALAPVLGVTPESIRLAPWTATAPPSTKPGALARALAGVIRTQYGSRLSAKDLDTITRQIRSGLERVDQLRKIDLANSDEPDFVFAASRLPQSPR
jgi:hypothetical protein